MKHLSKLGFALAAAAVISLPQAGQASTLTSTGNDTPVSNYQPSLAVTGLIRTTGLFNELGEIRWFGGNFAPAGFAKAEGQEIQINSNQALFSVLGTAYGGDGRTTFRLPDLQGRAVMGTDGRSGVGTKQGATTLDLGVAVMPAHTHDVNGVTSTSTGGGGTTSNLQPTLSMRNEIITQGVYPSRDGANPKEVIALVRPNAAVGEYLTEGYVMGAEGQTLAIANNTALFSLMGTAYGGDGRSTFKLPDLTDRIAVGDGSGPGVGTRQLGQMQGSQTITLSMGQLAAHSHGVDPADQAAIGTAVSGSAGNSQPVGNVQPELALRYMIAIQGLYPSRGGGGAPIFGGPPIVGEIAMFAGTFTPGGWLAAEGQLLQISQFDALFTILGTTFGGDGRTTFGLPDLRGRTAIGAGGGYRLGQKVGQDNFSLTAANLPAHDHDFQIPPPAVPLPAGFILLLSALFMPLVLGRKTR